VCVQIKLRYWEEAQRLKFEQNRELQNVLIHTAPTYLAVASQDKVHAALVRLYPVAQVFGTGWRKNRDESSKPRMWDGENGGGKVLMRLRDQFKAAHQWQAGEEEVGACKLRGYHGTLQETAKNVAELKKSVWRKEGGREGGFGGGSGGGRYQGGGTDEQSCAYGLSFRPLFRWRRRFRWRWLHTSRSRLLHRRRQQIQNNVTISWPLLVFRIHSRFAYAVFIYICCFCDVFFFYLVYLLGTDSLS
jgi:hypothetical protein